MKKGLAAVLAVVCLFSRPVLANATESTTINLTYDEAQELLKIAWVEAGNQGAEGQRYVMSVILNRVSSPDFPNTIHDVIYQKSQFASSAIDKAEPTAETHEALAEIEKGNVAPEIIAFEVKKNTKLEKYFSVAFDFRDHRFYTKKIE